jgi:hypothetical protein
VPGVPVRGLRPIARAALIGGAAEIASVIAGWDSRRGASAWLLVGGVVALGFGVMGLVHLSILAGGDSSPRASIFVLYYWVFPLAAITCAVLAPVSGISSVSMTVAEVLQAVSVVLVALWFAVALRGQPQQRSTTISAGG